MFIARARKKGVAITNVDSVKITTSFEIVGNMREHLMIEAKFRATEMYKDCGDSISAFITVIASKDEEFPEDRAFAIVYSKSAIPIFVFDIGVYEIDEFIVE